MNCGPHRPERRGNEECDVNPADREVERGEAIIGGEIDHPPRAPYEVAVRPKTTLSAITDITAATRVGTA